MIGEPAVAGIKETTNNWELSQRVQGPRPPDLSREINDGARAPVNFPFRRNDTHFAKQLCGRQPEQGLHARVLKRREAKATHFESALEAAGQ